MITLNGMATAFSPKTILQDIKALNQKQTGFLLLMLGTMLSLSLYWGDSLVGIYAGMTGVTCVFLVNMKKISNFSWGVVNCILYGYIAYNASYYGDTMLNWLFYLPAQFIGAYMWAGLLDKCDIKVKRVESFNTLIRLIVGAVSLVLLYAIALQKLGGNLSVVDATTTVLSVLATFFMVKGYREQWVCWITVNLLSIYMWLQVYFTTGEGAGVIVMWVMFLMNSIYGAYTWFKSTK